MNFSDTSFSEADPAKLLADLKSLCPMKRQELMFKKQTLRIWSACDLDPLLDALSEKPDDHPDILDERMPYWAELWPSSIVLAQAILHKRHPCPSGPWLELGCGPGLGGTAALMRGIPGVFTDYVPEALCLSALNALENQCEGWSARLVDWRDPPDGLSVPWILASDVAYEDRLFQPLLDCFEQFLTPDGEIWFSEPGRSICKMFFAEAEEQGWVRSIVHKENGIRVHRFKRPKAGSLQRRK